MSKGAVTPVLPVARVIVDVSLDKEFDYAVPDALRKVVHIGSQVAVPFGNRTVIGYVVAFSDKSEFAQLKAILRVVGDGPLITETVVKLARWMADYYACPLEQAVRTVLPGVIRNASVKAREVRMVQLTMPENEVTAGCEALKSRAPRQAMVLTFLLQHSPVPMSRVTRETRATPVTLRSMATQGMIQITKEVTARNPFDQQEVLATQPLPLMPQQAEALAQIRKAIETRDPGVVLLFGVTGSGKTEVYLQALQEVLENQHQNLLTS